MRDDWDGEQASSSHSERCLAGAADGLRDSWLPEPSSGKVRPIQDCSSDLLLMTCLQLQKQVAAGIALPEGGDSPIKHFCFFTPA